MAATPLATVLCALPSLPSEELHKVSTKVKALLALRGGRTGKEDEINLTSSPFDYILEGIKFELRKRGLIKTNGFIPKQYWPKNYEQSVKELQSLLEGQFPYPPEQAILNLLGRLCAEALAVYLEPVIPISSSALMSNIHKVPTALDQMLPGYLQAGLLFVVLDRGNRLNRD